MSMNTLRYKLHNSLLFRVIIGGTVAAMVITAVMGLGSNSPNRLPNGFGGGDSSTDSSVVTVNGAAVSMSAVTRQMEQEQKRMTQSGQPYSIIMQPSLRAKAVQDVVDSNLLLQEAKRRGITASDSEVEQTRKQIIAESQLATQLGLKSTATDNEIDAALTNQGQLSLSARFPTEQIRQSLILQKLEKQVQDAAVVTDQTLTAGYTDYHTRHILIGNKTRSDVQALQRANEVIAKVSAPGADFAALAKQYSDDPGTKDKGGDDGFINQDTGYVPEFKKAAFALSPGKVTQVPVKSPSYGYFVIKLDSVKQKLPADFAKNKAKYTQDAKQRLADQKLSELLTSLRANPANKIVVTDPQLRADREMSMGSMGQGDVTANLKSAIADYQIALKNSPSVSTTTEINVGLASAYQGLKDNTNTIASLKAAADNSSDPQIFLALAGLYAKTKQNALGIAATKSAVQNSLDDQQIHQEAISLYQQLGAKTEVSDELKWLASHRQDTAGGPGGMNFSMPSGGGSQSTHITVPATTALHKSVH